MNTEQLAWVLWPGLIAAILGGSSVLYARWLNAKAPPQEHRSDAGSAGRKTGSGRYAFLTRKEAQIVKDVGLPKGSYGRIETVRDTVRETDIDIDIRLVPGPVSTTRAPESAGTKG